MNRLQTASLQMYCLNDVSESYVLHTKYSQLCVDADTNADIDKIVTYICITLNMVSQGRVNVDTQLIKEFNSIVQELDILGVINCLRESNLNHFKTACLLLRMMELKLDIRCLLSAKYSICLSAITMPITNIQYNEHMSILDGIKTKILNDPNLKSVVDTIIAQQSNTTLGFFNLDKQQLYFRSYFRQQQLNKVKYEQKNKSSVIKNEGLNSNDKIK